MVTYKFNQSVTKKYMDLPACVDGVLKTSLTYVWIDASGQSLRSKTKTVNVSQIEKIFANNTTSVIPDDVKESLTWEFCGAGTGFREPIEAKEAEEVGRSEMEEEKNVRKAFEAEKSRKSKAHSSCELRPCAVYNDPFHGGQAKLILCEVYYNGKPVVTNNRKECLDTLKEEVIETPKCNVTDLKTPLVIQRETSNKNDCFAPLFGIEQEYTLIDPKTNRPLGWPESGFPAPQGPYYCGVGTGSAIGRDIAEAHYRACLYANIPIYGYIAEVMPGQWEFQVGECEGIKMGDDLWMARFILVRLAEEFGVKVSFDPKPVEGDWNGAGAHINFSSKGTRAENGILKIYCMIKDLEKNHKEAFSVYDPNGGKDNARRLTGKHETSKIDEFTWGFDDRFCSIRIPRSVEKTERGYFEDRRPASNSDPYKVITYLINICAKYF